MINSARATSSPCDGIEKPACLAKVEALLNAGKVSDAWINFARKGDPNHSGLPKWPTYSADPGPVMVFDKTCEVKNDPDRELRKAVASALT